MENTVEQSQLPESQSSLIDMRANTAIQIVLLGVIVGAATWLIALIVDRFILSSLMCGSAESCEAATVTAGNIALVLTAIGALLGLVKLGVYRPLLVVLAASIVLWSMSAILLGVQWYEALAWTVLLYALSYIAFSWFVRPRFFLAAIILVMAVVITARILPAVL